jgi:hypothetical protein
MWPPSYLHVKLEGGMFRPHFLPQNWRKLRAEVLQFYDVNFCNTFLSMAGEVRVSAVGGEQGSGQIFLLNSIPALLLWSSFVEDDGRVCLSVCLRFMMSVTINVSRLSVWRWKLLLRIIFASHMIWFCHTYLLVVDGVSSVQRFSEQRLGPERFLRSLRQLGISNIWCIVCGLFVFAVSNLLYN